jgi:hypothetical protein
MRFLRSSGLPVPEIYDYSPSSDNGVYFHVHGVYERYEAQRRVDGAGGTGYRFGLASNCPARVSHDVDSFSGWWKPLLCQRPGEGGRGDGHPAQRRALLRRSGC